MTVRENKEIHGIDLLWNDELIASVYKSQDSNPARNGIVLVKFHGPVSICRIEQVVEKATEFMIDRLTW